MPVRWRDVWWFFLGVIWASLAFWFAGGLVAWWVR